MRLDSFNKELFWEEPDEGLYEVDVGLRAPEGDVGNHLQAFADLNNDRYTDIITINEAKTLFTVHLYEPLKKLFVYQKSFKPSDCSKITNIAVGRSVDRIRLFVTCQTVSLNVQGKNTVVKIFDKYGKYIEFEEQPTQISIESGSQPFIADLNGDFLEDIIYTDTNHELKVAFQKRNPLEFTLTDFDSSLLVTDETEGCLVRKTGKRKLSIPHSTSLVDFDGDCMSDLFITTTDLSSGKSYYEIYLRREVEQVEDLQQTEDQISAQSANQTFTDTTLRGLNAYCLVLREEIPSLSGNLFHFTDVDRDAMVDMLFVTRNDLSLHIYYNKLANQMPHSSTPGQSSLNQNFKQICADTNRPINKVKDIYQQFSQVDEKYVVKQLISRDSNAADLYSDDEQAMPGRIYIGDVTSDGYPDILLTMKYINSTTRSHILVNQPCDGQCTQKAQRAKRRTFNLQYNQYQELLDNFDKVRYATFFDLNENSMMDILLVNGPQAEISAIYNNFAKDAFFLKARVISDESIGNTLFSASFRCVLTDLDDQKFITMTGQSGQTAYQALQMPFAQIGIGRSNNFIEQFTVAVPTNGTRSIRRWTPIIPKSVLFVLLNSVDKDTTQPTDSWGLDILVKPNDKIILIILVDAVFLLILGLIIIILHLLEKSEDRKEAKDLYF